MVFVMYCTFIWRQSFPNVIKRVSKDTKKSWWSVTVNWGFQGFPLLLYINAYTCAVLNSWVNLGESHSCFISFSILATSQSFFSPLSSFVKVPLPPLNQITFYVFPCLFNLYTVVLWTEFRLIESNAKCRYLPKKWPVKGLFGRCLSVWSTLPS